ARERLARFKPCSANWPRRAPTKDAAPSGKCAMNAPAFPIGAAVEPDTGLRALCGIAAFYRIAADPAHLSRELALQGRIAAESDLVRAAAAIGLKARIVERIDEARLRTLPTPAIVRCGDG